MRVWRLTRRAHALFDGEGARLAGGRWNHRATPVVYTSETASLAVLEYYVNLDPDQAPADLVIVPADLPDDLELSELGIGALPHDWRHYPAPESLAELGTAWARARKTPVLAVPSVVVPQERNYLLNPVHPAFRRIVVGRPEGFSFDPRMWKVR